MTPDIFNMAIGLFPKYTASYPLAGLTGQTFLVLAVEAAARLGWRLQYLSPTGFIGASLPWIARVIIRIDGDSVNLSSTSIARELWDRGRNKENISRFIHTLDELKAEIPVEYLAARYEELALMLPPPGTDALQQPTAKVSSAAADIFAIFKPVKGYFITPLILNLNLLVFLLMILTGVDLMNPDSRSLLAWGANLRPLTLGGEWWRLITCCFIHIGALHLLMNMYAFLLIGAQLEPRLGRTRFLTAYILSGIVASATSLWWHDNNNSISAGASGAIFGMYGVFLVMLNANLVEKGKRKQLLASVIFFVGYNLLGGLQPGIDNAAHIGGLLTGLVISTSFIPGLRKAQSRKLAEEPDVSGQVAEDIQPPVTTKDDYYS